MSVPSLVGRCLIDDTVYMHCIQSAQRAVVDVRERVREGEEEEISRGGQIWLIEVGACCNGERRAIVEVA